MFQSSRFKFALVTLHEAMPVFERIRLKVRGKTEGSPKFHSCCITGRMSVGKLQVDRKGYLSVLQLALF